MAENILVFLLLIIEEESKCKDTERMGVRFYNKMNHFHVKQEHYFFRLLSVPMLTNILSLRCCSSCSVAITLSREIPGRDGYVDVWWQIHVDNTTLKTDTYTKVICSVYKSNI